MRLRLMLLLLVGGNLSAATLRPTLTFATTSDVSTVPLSALGTTFSSERWTTAMMSNAINASVSARNEFHPFKPEFRPERRQGETPSEYANDYDAAIQMKTDVQLALGTLDDGFEGLGAGFRLADMSAFSVDAQAPDTSGAAGLDQYVQIVNQSLAVFRKSDGKLLLGPIESGEIWHDFKGECGNGSGVDPVVLFDRLEGRWLVTSMIRSVNDDGFQCVAVSQSSDATGLYARYEFPFGKLFNDYGKFAVWPDAYYATYDLFDGGVFKNTRVCAYDRDAMLRGAAKPGQQCVDLPPKFDHLLPSDMDGIPPMGATPPNFIVGIGPQKVNLWHYTINWSNASASALTGPTAIAVKAYQWGCVGCIAQQGSKMKLTPMGDRPMFRNTYRSRSGVESLLVTHTVTVMKSNQALTGIRWYEFTDPRTTPAVVQQATYSPDTASRWMPSMAMDKAGNIAIGYSVSSATSFPSMFIAGRTVNQTASTLSKEMPIRQSKQSKPASDWGDYSHMSIDPTDDCTFWYTSEYLDSPENRWHTRIVHFKFNGCT
jgi:hypothetical protein